MGATRKRELKNIPVEGRSNVDRAVDGTHSVIDVLESTGARFASGAGLELTPMVGGTAQRIISISP